MLVSVSWSEVDLMCKMICLQHAYGLIGNILCYIRYNWLFIKCIMQFFYTYLLCLLKSSIKSFRAGLVSKVPSVVDPFLWLLSKMSVFFLLFHGIPNKILLSFTFTRLLLLCLVMTSSTTNIPVMDCAQVIPHWEESFLEFYSAHS